MKARRYLSTLLTLAACAAVPQVSGQPPTEPYCQARLRQDDTRWCATLGVTGYYGLIRQSANSEPVFAALPIPPTRTLIQEITLGYGFDSIWVGYSGHPMGVLRINAETLAMEAQIAPGRDGIVFGSMGYVRVGVAAVWVLSSYKLYRVDPSSNAVTQIQLQGPVEDAAEGQGALWVAMSDRVLELDLETLETRRTFTLPQGMRVSAPPCCGGYITVDKTSVKVELLKKLFSRQAGPRTRLGQVDPLSGTVVLLGTSPDY